MSFIPRARSKRNGVFEREVKVPIAQMQHCKKIFDENPALLAARSVIHAQLLSSGLVLKRDGEVVEVTAEFRHHLDEEWCNFARDVIDHLMIIGFCVVSYEEEDTDGATRSLRDRRRIQSRQDAGETNMAEGFTMSTNMVPCVAPIGSYEVGFVLTGRAGMRRSYSVYRQGNRTTTEPDNGCVLFIRQEPDEYGNVNSPMSAVSGLSKFISEMMNLAIVAERSRARPPLVTQTRQKIVKGGGAPADMYFDAESRAIERQGAEEDDAHAARALELQLQLCRAINDYQTFGRGDRLAASLTGRTDPSDANGSAQEEVGVRMVALPVNQEAATISSAESRPDLVNMMHMTMENMCTAIGVPSSLLFEGRFSGQSSAQMALLNSTVQQLGRRVDSILTDVFNDIYDEIEDDGLESESDDAAADAPTQSSLPGAGVDPLLGESNRGIEAPTPSQLNAGEVSGTKRNPLQGREKRSSKEGKRRKSSGSAKRKSEGSKTTKGVELVTTAAPLSAAAEVMSLFSGGLADFEAAAPLALHAVGLSQAEITAALERHKKLEAKLERERLAAEKATNAQAAAGSSSSSGSKSSASSAPPQSNAASTTLRGTSTIH
jgi:hypothetical protein